MGIVATATPDRQVAPSAQGATRPPRPPRSPRPGTAQRARAERAARSLLARAEFLADAPAGQLATPFTVRQAARGMARDARALLAALADPRASLDTLAARDPFDGPTAESEGARHVH